MANPNPSTGFHTNPERINRNGRPKGISITEIVKKALEEKPKGGKETYAELIKKRILNKAIVEGDIQMLKAIWSYIDGMPSQKIETKADQEQFDEFMKGLRSIVIDENQENNK